MNKHLLELSIDDYIDYERIERLRAVYEKRVASIDAQRALIEIQRLTGQAMVASVVGASSGDSIP